jgi:hypothetical protein
LYMWSQLCHCPVGAHCVVIMLPQLHSSATQNVTLYLTHGKNSKERYGLFFLWLLCHYPPSPLTYANKPKALSTTQVYHVIVTDNIHAKGRCRRNGGWWLGECESWGWQVDVGLFGIFL